MSWIPLLIIGSLTSYTDKKKHDRQTPAHIHFNSKIPHTVTEKNERQQKQVRIVPCL